MNDPVELLQERLDEIEKIQCDDISFLRYKMKYKSAIRFLKLYGFESHKDNRYKVNTADRLWLRENYENGKSQYYAHIFGVSVNTIHNIINEIKNNE